jgi:antitoxin (DNA-binding transcriptional repressor) of toxin-antitoxin stability system
VIESTARAVAERLPEFLEIVGRGESVRITSDGRVVARLIPDSTFISGKQAAGLFSKQAADHEAANAISLEIQKLRVEAEDALDHRH